jgi:hypothetical protein
MFFDNPFNDPRVDEQEIAEKKHFVENILALHTITGLKYKQEAGEAFSGILQFNRKGA